MRVWGPRVWTGFAGGKGRVGRVGGVRAVQRRCLAQVRDIKIEVIRIEPGMQRRVEMNVFHRPLQLHSKDPVTGFTRTGFCSVPSSDAGNHSVAAVLTEAFLDFTASRGNDLRAAGLKAGSKWCLCVERWKEAFDARESEHDEKVPRVYLHRTNLRALDTVPLSDLKKFAIDYVEPPDQE